MATDKKACWKCGNPMEFEECDNLDCRDGMDASDCLGLRRCSQCSGSGGAYYCLDCQPEHDPD